MTYLYKVDPSALLRPSALRLRLEEVNPELVEWVDFLEGELYNFSKVVIIHH